MTRPCHCTRQRALQLQQQFALRIQHRREHRTFYFQHFSFFGSPINTPLSLCPRHGQSAAKPINTSRSPHKRADRSAIRNKPRPDANVCKRDRYKPDDIRSRQHFVRTTDMIRFFHVLSISISEFAR